MANESTHPEDHNPDQASPEARVHGQTPEITEGETQMNKLKELWSYAFVKGDAAVSRQE
jgi:hypothetical protein